MRVDQPPLALPLKEHTTMKTEATSSEAAEEAKSQVRGDIEPSRNGALLVQSAVIVDEHCNNGKRDHHSYASCLSTAHQDPAAPPCSSSDACNNEAPPDHGAAFHSAETLNRLYTSGPINSFRGWMTSFSLVNSFLFLPPTPGSYGFDHNFDEAMGERRHNIRARRIFIPWSHAHVDGSGTTIGKKPHLFYGGGVISCVELTHMSPAHVTTNNSPCAPLAMQTHRGSPSFLNESTLRTAVSSSENVTPTSCATPPQSAAASGFDFRHGTQPRTSSSLTNQQAEPQQLTVGLYFHGNAADCGPDSVRGASSFLLTLPSPSKLFMVEYPGYGTMDGEPNEGSVKATAERVVQFLFATSPASFTPCQLVLMAHSVGTGVALHILKVVTEAFEKERDRAAESERWRYYVGGVLLLAPFSSVATVVNDRADVRWTMNDDSIRYGMETDIELSIRDRAANGISEIKTWLEKKKHMPLVQVNGVTDADTNAAATMPVTTLIDGFDSQTSPLTPQSPSVMDASPATPMQPPSSPLPSERPARELGFIYNAGNSLMFDRFVSSEVVHELQRRYRCFEYTCMIVAHGVSDSIIPCHHALRLCTAIYQGCMRAEYHPRRCGTDGRTVSQPEVLLCLSTSHDHNSIADIMHIPGMDQALRRLRSLLTARHNPTSTAAGSLMPSITVTATQLPLTYMDSHLVPFGDARSRHEIHVAYIEGIRRLVVTATLVLGLWVLAVGILHVLLGDSDATSTTILVWSVLECCVIVGVAALTGLTPTMGLFTISNERPSHIKILLYVIGRCIVYLLALAVGIILGASCALSSSVCPLGGTATWCSGGGDQTRVWGCAAPKYTMLTMCAAHLGHALWTWFRNH